MTGLTTTAALYKLQYCIKKGLDTQPRYLYSPFVTCSSIAGVCVLIIWVAVCGLYPTIAKQESFATLHVSVGLGILLLLTVLFFVIDTRLSYKEKINSINDILNVIQGYNLTHEVQRSSVSSSKLGFYLSETYPSSTSVSVQRVYRNGKVVSVGQTLLVQGDIILLNPGEEAPTDCVSLSGEIALKKGDIFSDKSDFAETEVKECVIEQAKLPTLFSVCKTDYQTLVKEFLCRNRLPSKLRLEIQSTLNIINCAVLPVVLGLSALAAALQYTYLNSGTELLNVLVTVLPLLPTIYPLYYTLVYYVSTAMVISSSYNMEHHTLRDPMKTPDNTSNHLNMRELKTTKQILVLTYKILVGKLYCCLPRNSNIFDTLSAVTVLCTVNKEGILSRPNPHVERIMLLDPCIPESLSKEKLESSGLEPVQEISGALSAVSSTDRSRLLSTTSDSDYKTEGDPLLAQAETSSLPNIHSQSESSVKKVRSLQNSFRDSKFSIESEYRKLSEEVERSDLLESGESVSVETEDIQIKISETEKVPADRKSRIWLPRLVTGRRLPSLHRNRTKSERTDEIVLEGEVSESPMLSGSESKVKKKRKHFWQMMKIPRYRTLMPENEQMALETEATHGTSHDSASLKEDFIVVLNVSLSKHSPFGLTFDCKNMAHLLGSLKPVGLAVLLNNTCHDVRSLMSSHLNYISVQHYCGLTFKLPLPTDYCNCVIGREIGFTRSVVQQYQKISKIVTYVPCDNTRRTQRNPVDNMTPLTCVVSSVIRDKVTGNRHIMSYGTAPFILKCCTGYWTGKDVQKLQPEHRARVLEFYNQNRLTCHCFLVSYRPLLVQDIAPQHDVFVSLPKGYTFLDEVCTTSLDPGENLLKLQSGQTLLGVLCAQFQPKHDIVSTIESLVSANIRFVHFSYDNELRSRAFGTKLGLETGWNCHISLAEGDFDNFSVDSDSNSADAENFHFYYCKARLPQGIKNIRPHLENVDNVPLLVPLFTSCTPTAIKEMICIMQENQELVCCIGSSLQINNFGIFLQADSSLGMIPHLPQNCLISGIKDMSVPWESGDYRTPPESDQVNCLHLTSILNTLPCSLVVSRDNCRPAALIQTARGMSVAFRQSGHVMISLYCAVSLWGLLHQLLLLPPPISLPQCLFVCLIVIPLLASTPFSLEQDSKIMDLHTGKREACIRDSSTRHFKHFLLRWGGLLLTSPLGTAFSLKMLCEGNCRLFFGNSGTNEGRFDEKSTYYLIQSYNCVLLSVLLSIHSYIFSHRTKPVNLSYFLHTATKWTAIIPAVSCVVTVLVLLASGGLSSLPPYPLLILLLSLPLIHTATALLSKKYDRKLWTRDQRRQKLKFGTKLGMNSPF